MHTLQSDHLTPSPRQAFDNHRWQVVGVTVFAVFTDILGTAMVVPALANLCAYAPGGPAETLADEIRNSVPANMSAAVVDQMIKNAQEVPFFPRPHLTDHT